MIELENVSYVVDGVEVLRDVSLTVTAGEFVVLAGTNGSGKTTLLRHCNGLVTPTDGQVRVNGTPVDEDLLGCRSAVGMVFQHPRDQFVAATVGADVAFGPENLGLEREEIDRRVAAALEAVNLAGRADDRIDQLSGGEQARVAIAGALAMAPQYLALDEPLTGLDEPARRSVLERLGALHADGTGILFATHDLRAVAPMADRIVALADGEVVVDEPRSVALEELTEFGVRVS